MGEVIGGGVEIECWREIVPVLLQEARRLTVHIQFRSIKFSMLRREFHIKLSSEEDHCFLYKTAVTQEIYQRFVHYHNLDVPFDQFSDYMHHLIHSVKNSHDYGERFFINIYAHPGTHLPPTVDFIISQRQMGCLVQSKRLSLTFALASDAELKEHLISCFDRLKREKDHAQRRNCDLETELMAEKSKVKEFEERNRYLQKELEFSQTLIKSAETLQNHYEALLKQQQGKEQIQLPPPPGSLFEEKPLPVMSHRPESDQLLPPPPPPPSNQQQPQQQHHVVVHSTSSHLDTVMNYLSSMTAAELRDPPPPSPMVQMLPPLQHHHQQQQQSQQPIHQPHSQQHALLQVQEEDHHQQQQQQQHHQQGQQMQQPQTHNNSVTTNSMLSSDPKKLKGAAKRKASFHNLTNPNNANNANSSLEQQQQAQPQPPPQQQHQVGVGGHVMPETQQAQTQALHEHLARLHESHHLQQQHHHQQQPQQQGPPQASSLINPMNLLDEQQRHEVFSIEGPPPSVHNAFIPPNVGLHEYLNDGMNRGLNSSSSLSPALGSSTNELIDGLSELNDADWTGMKMEYGATDFPVDLADVTSVDGASFAQSLSEASLLAAQSSADSALNDPKNMSMDGVLSYFKCLICDCSYNVGSSHMAQHVTEMQTCAVCTDVPVFESKDDLVKHMLGHSARIYACQYCGKENPRVHYLKIHVRSHTGEKPYTCHQCGRGFADASTWRRHERVHTGEKPYQCNICGRKIARRDNVKIHMRSHMRSKPQSACRTCGKAFNQLNHLNLHERICGGGQLTSPDMKPLLNLGQFQPPPPQTQPPSTQ